MADISLSKAVRSNLLSLQSTAQTMAKTQERLATGNKVNSALDNPTNFFTASALNSRAGDMGNLMDSMSNGIKTIEAADNGLKSITKTVESMQSTLRQARQDKSFKSQSFAIDSGATGNLAISGGAVGATAVNIGLVSPASATQSSVTASAAFVAPVAGTGPTFGAGAYSELDISNGNETYSFTVSKNGGAGVAVQIDPSDYFAGVPTQLSIWDTIDGINADLIAGGSTIRAQLNGTFTGIDFYDSDGANTGTAATIDVSAVTTGGTTPGGSLGWVGDPAAAAGTNGVDRVISITTGAGTTGNITLTSANAATAAQARVTIQNAIDAVGALNGTITVGGTGNNINLLGAADGSNTITVGGADVASVFGAGHTDVAGSAGSAASVKTVDALVTEINNNSSLKDKVRASNDAGKLRIEDLSTESLTLTGIGSNGEVDGTAGTASIGGNEVRKNLVKQFNELRDQLDKLADDASFNGINLLRGDKLKLTFNETGTSTIDIQARKSDGTATSINNGTLGILTAVNADFDADTTLDARLSTLSDALGALRSHASSFGSNLSIVQNRQDFTKSMINTLETGAANLTLADTNEEAANLLALQTRQQLSSTALSMASQADQAVLRLF